MRTLALCLLLAAAASAQTERKPNDDFENAYPRWSPAVFADSVFDSANQISVETITQMSVAIDRRGTIHVAARRSVPGVVWAQIVYMNSRQDLRRANGLSAPVILDQIVNTGFQDLNAPCIYVHSDDTVHVAWQNSDNTFGLASDIWYATKTSSGWSASQNLTNGNFGTAQVPRLAVDSLGREQFVFWGSGTIYRMIPSIGFSEAVNTGPSFSPSFPVYPPTGPGYLRMLLVPGAPNEVWLAAQGSSSGGFGVHFNHRTAGTWNGWTFFGQSGDSAPDLARTSSGTMFATAIRGGTDVIFFSGTNFGTQQTVFTGLTTASARIFSDSRGQVHIVTSTGSAPYYAAKVKNPNPNALSANFYSQTPIVAPLVGVRAMTDVWEAAISPNDQIVFCDDDQFTYTMGYDLNPFSAAAAIPSGPYGGNGNPAAPPKEDCPCSCGPNRPDPAGNPMFPEINAINGNISYDLPIFTTNGLAPSQTCSLHYNTQDPAMSSIAPGWRLNYEWVLFDPWADLFVDNLDSILLSIPGDRNVNFIYSSSRGYHVAEDEYGYYARLERLTSHTSPNVETAEYLLTLKSGLRFTFNNKGRLRRIEELTGNYINLEFNGSGQLTVVRDQVGNGPVTGRSTTIAYELGTNPLIQNRITRITDVVGRRYDLGYNDDKLITVKYFDGPSQPTWGFDYYPLGSPGPDGFRNVLKIVRTPEGQAAGTQYGQTYKYYPDGRFKGLDDPAELYLADGDPDSFTPTVPAVASTTMTYEETLDPYGASPRVTTTTNRRGFDTKIYNEPRRSLVVRVDDADYLAAEPGVNPTFYFYDATFPVNRNITLLRDRWNFDTNYIYAPMPGGALIPVQDNLFQVFRPKVTGVGQDKVVEITYTTDDHNRTDLFKTFATPTGGGPVATRTTDYNWNSFGQLTLVTYPNVTRPDGATQAGVTTSYTYAGARKQLTQITGEEGMRTFFNTFDSLHYLPLNVTRDGGSQAETFTYDQMGNLATRTQPIGGAGNESPGATIFGRDGMYRVISTTDPAGKVTGFGYTRNSQLNLIDPPVGDNTTTAYDHREFVKSGVTPDGSWSQFVDAEGNVGRVIDLRGFASNSDFDEMNHLEESRMPGGTTLGAGLGGGYNDVVSHNSINYTGIHITVYDHHGFSGGIHFMTATQLGAPADRVTKTEYNNRGLASATLEADLLTRTEFTYDEQGQATERLSKYNAVAQTKTLLFRDARDRVDHVEVLDPGTPANQSYTYKLYNKANSVVKTADPLATVAGSVNWGVMDHKVRYDRDVRERVQFVADGKNVLVEENVYGDDDLVTSTKWCDPATKSSTRVVRMTYTYTKRKELKSAKNLNGFGMDYTYGNLPDQIATATNAGGIVTHTTYEPFTQRIFEIIEAEGTADESRTKYTWVNGLLAATTVWNPASLAYDAVHGRDYDKASRLERLTAPTVATGTQIAAERYLFNAFDETAQFIAGSKTIAHTYNAIGQPTQSQWTGAYAVTVLRQFDEVGNPKSIDDGSRKREMDYDRWINNPTQERFFLPGGGSAWKTQTHGFDIGGNYRTFADAEAGSHTWDVDENNRVTDIKFATLPVSKHYYTPGGLLDKTEHFDSVGALIATTREFYDTLGRLAERKTVAGSAGATLADFVWSYDARDRRTGINLVHQTLSFTLTYDNRDQLLTESTVGNGTIPAKTSTWTYDPVGNRKSQVITGGATTTYTYNAASQLKTEVTGNKSVRYDYDQWANQTSRNTQIQQGQRIALSTEAFTYNYLNLLAIYRPGPVPIHPGGATPPTGWQYDYWPTGDRAAKANLKPVPSQSELYVPRFGDVATEYSQVGTGAITFTNRYVQGTSIDSKSTRIDAAGVRRHYLGDGVGTVGLTLTDTATIAEQTIRDVWGNRLSTGSSAERYGFAQRESDNESGLVHMRNRQYDPRIGRFTQRDPIRQQVPTEHYFYARNNPAALIDPLGLAPALAGLDVNAPEWGPWPCSAKDPCEDQDNAKEENDKKVKGLFKELAKTLAEEVAGKAEEAKKLPQGAGKATGIINKLVGLNEAIDGTKKKENQIGILEAYKLVLRAGLSMGGPPGETQVKLMMRNFVHTLMDDCGDYLSKGMATIVMEAADAAFLDVHKSIRGNQEGAARLIEEIEKKQKELQDQLDKEKKEKQAKKN
jgi:RHS repeat-associated protein